jgi:4-hydroxybenzoate polyprenyltransferase
MRRGSRVASAWLSSLESAASQLLVQQQLNGVWQATQSPLQQCSYHCSNINRIEGSNTSLISSSLVASQQLPLPFSTLSQSPWQPRFYSTAPEDRQESQPSSTSKTWVDKLPASWIPYAHLSRLEKPIGTWLLAWPCFWSIGLAAPAGSLPDLSMIALFGAGSVLLRGAGCTVNDLWDRDLDGKVERTRTRPLPSGAVSPIQAVGWLGAQLGLGFGVLLQLNGYSQALGASSLALVVAYPLMKRVTGWPQAFLGLTFNWGALLGWAAIRGTCDWTVVLPLYFGGVAWTLVYDTIYAHQDKKDDVAAGIKSTALAFGKLNREYLTAFVIANAACIAAAGYAAGCGAPYYAGLAAAVTHLGWQAATVNFDDAEDCGNKFRSNCWYGALLFAGITADRLLAASETLMTVAAVV